MRFSLVLKLIVVIAIPFAFGALVAQKSDVSAQVEMFDVSEMTSFTQDQVPETSAIEKKMKQFKEVLTRTPKQEGKLLPISVFQDNYDTFGPEVMLDVLNQDLSCHSQAHNLGRVIYAHTKDLAAGTMICQNKCSSGCVHGVLMAMFNEMRGKELSYQPGVDPSIKMLTPDMRSQISQMCKRSEITRYTGIGNCYHAVGHALLALTDYDIPQALKLCDIFEPYGIGAQYYCATGVYMEEEITLGKSDSRFFPTGASSTDPSLYPCDQYEYPAACYRYKINLLFTFPDDSEKVTALCLRLTGAQQTGCFHGIGFSGAYLIYKNPDALNMVCGSGSEEDKRMCIEGAFGIINVHDKSKGIVAKACSTYTAGSKEICTDSIGITNFTMKRDFKRYPR